MSHLSPGKTIAYILTLFQSGAAKNSLSFLCATVFLLFIRLGCTNVAKIPLNISVTA